MSDPREIVIIDSGLGNVASIANMLRVLRVPSVTTGDPQRVREATALILPGVGSFDQGMSRLDAQGLTGPIQEAARDRHVPILGICLGMQLLTDSSEEGERSGLGLVPGRTMRIPVPTEGSGRCKLPHMGWQDIRIEQPDELWADAVPEPRFYFVHSYHVVPNDPFCITATARYGEVTVTAAVRQGRVRGTQFHPEKSHRYGMWLLGNFARIPRC